MWTEDPDRDILYHAILTIPFGTITGNSESMANVAVYILPCISCFTYCHCDSGNKKAGSIINGLIGISKPAVLINAGATDAAMIPARKFLLSMIVLLFIQLGDKFINFTG